VQVASVDGTTDEFNLRNGTVDIAGPVGAAGAAGLAGQRRFGNSGSARGEKWAPWNEPWAGGPNAQGAAAQPKKKPKTLFDLLFN
jgi:hypothetical protein